MSNQYDPEFEPSPAKQPGPETSGKSIASMVLGLLSIFLCLNLLTGIPAIILGALGLGETGGRSPRYRGRGMALTGLITGIIGSTLMPLMVLIALLLPAVQAAREAARRAQSTNNLKQIGLAMHNYHDSTGSLPPASLYDDFGRPVASWRVRLLPYIEQGPLYDAYNFDLPWDSPANTTVANSMPDVYLCPSQTELPPDHTTYLAVTGPGTAFDDELGGVKFWRVTDGLSSTLGVVESSRPVPWTQPDAEIDFDPAGPLPTEFGSMHPGGFNALFLDGSVRFISDATPEQTLRALCTRDGGEVIGADGF